jgi:hypothetical protein
MSRGPDSATQLERALVAAATSRHHRLAITGWTMRRWASATFSGARHRITATLPAAARDWLDELPEVEFALRGHLVADLTVAAIEAESTDADLAVTLEVLTLEAR